MLVENYIKRYERENNERESKINLGKGKIHELEADSVAWKALLHHRGSTVYVIKCDKYYKIGMTDTSISQRMDALQGANPFKLELVFAIKTGNAKVLEEKLHKKFEHKRVRREWFELKDEDFMELEKYIHAYFEAKESS